MSDRDYLVSIGAFYAEQGFTLCTGNAPGADQLFALGGSSIDPAMVELYLPWANFERRAITEGNKIFQASQALPRHVELARASAPGFDEGIRDTVKPLLIRDAMIVYRFDDPVDLVLAWPNFTKRGWGGTGHAMRTAAALGIPVFLLNRWCYWNFLEGMPVAKTEE
jgi:hypothetical protein